MRGSVPVLLVLLHLAHGVPARAGTACVEPTGSGGCFDTIGAALAAADPGDVIRVAAGSYVENLLIDTNVILEGGWNAAFTLRDPSLHVATIEPALPEQSVVEIAGSFADPGSSTPVFDGFTVTGGRGDLGGYHGGGIRIRDSHATVRNSTIVGNRGFLFGGGIWVQRGTPRFERIRVQDNVAVGDASLGGGIDLEGTAGTVEIVDSAIVGNTIDGVSGLGGGLFAGGHVSIRGTLFEDNSAGASCTGTGGAVYVSDSFRLEVRSNRMVGNCAAEVDHVWVRNGFFYGSLFVSRPPSTAEVLLRVESTSGGPSIQNCTFAWEGDAPPRTVEFHDDEANAADAFPVDNSVFVAVSTVTVDVARLVGQANVFSGGGTPGNEPSLGFVEQDPLLDATYHLTPASPLVDAGVRRPVPTSDPQWYRDMDGELRPTDGGSGRFRMDIGADELDGPAQRVELLSEGQPPDLTIIGPGNPPENPDSIGTNDWIGYSVLADDVSGDGQADLLFTAQDWAEDFDTLNATGRVFGLHHFGERRSGVLDLRSGSPDFQIVCLLELEHFGESLAAGDLDDDGTNDLIVASSDTHGLTFSVPMITIHFGGPSLATSGATVETGSLGDFAVRSPDSESLAFAGENGVAVGDLDGDDVDDLAVGDNLAPDGMSAGIGAVHVFFGGQGLGGTRDLSAAAADFTLYGPPTSDPTFGSGPYAGGIAIGDLDDDGQADLVARDSTRTFVLFGPLSPGEHRLASQAADVFVGGLEAGGVLVMDATGDGVDDLVLDGSGAAEVSDPFESGLHVIAGPLLPGALPSAEGAAAFTLTGLTIRGGPARSLATGDVGGDARPDLLVGAPESPHGSHAYAVPPGAYGPGDVPIVEVATHVVEGGPGAADAPYRNTGWDVAAGDLDGDGREDLVIGTQNVIDPLAASAETGDVGKVLVIYGSPEPGAAAGSLAALATLSWLARRRGRPARRSETAPGR